MSKENYVPYTYLIGWSKLNWWYYGSEYAKTNKIANPSNLWTTYFTSSKEVAIVRDLYGEPNIIQIRHIFTNAKDTKIWETKVLKRMKVVGDTKWLNKTDHLHYIPQYGKNSPNYKPKIQKICEICSDIFYVKPSLIKQRFCSNPCTQIYKSRIMSGKNNPMFGKTRPDTVLQNSIKKTKQYIFVNPNGKKQIIIGLYPFCIQHNLNRSLMYKVWRGKILDYDGWKRWPLP